jgi:hypothetical protein
MTLFNLWQARITDAPAGSRVSALTYRQAGKMTGASVAVAHTMLWRRPASTNLVLAPTLRQSSERACHMNLAPAERESKGSALLFHAAVAARQC